MPITQAQVIELMKESRGNLTLHHQLVHTMREYFANARARYHQNVQLCEVLNATEALIDLSPQMKESATWKNEYHYRKVARMNDKQRQRQEVIRRMAGVPTREEALVILNAKNELRRADLPTDLTEYQRAIPADAISAPFAKSLPEITPEMIPVYVERKATPLGQKIIFPRDDPDDKELEFDLPPTATLDIGGPKLLDENNLQSGIDIPAELLDDDNGNPAKESEI